MTDVEQTTVAPPCPAYVAARLASIEAAYPDPADAPLRFRLAILYAINAGADALLRRLVAEFARHQVDRGLVSAAGERVPGAVVEALTAGEGAGATRGRLRSLSG